jgi:hypothetical protein
MRRKIIFGAVLIVVIAAIFGVLSMSVAKRRVPSGAIAFVDVGPTTSSAGTPMIGGTVAASSVSLTNTSSKALFVEFVSMQIEPGKWHNENDPFFFRTGPFVVPPHGSKSVVLSFPVAPPAHPWLFRLKVREELKGPERALMAGEVGLRRLVNRLNGGPRGPVFSSVAYYGHRTEIIVSEDRDGPKVAGGRQ